MSDGVLTFFDFDYCGLGWRSYDIAVFRWALEMHKLPEEEIKRSWESFIDGYLSNRKLYEIDIKVIPLFVAVRQLWLMGSHMGSKDNWHFRENKIDQYLNFLRSLKL